MIGAAGVDADGQFVSLRCLVHWPEQAPAEWHVSTG